MYCFKKNPYLLELLKKRHLLSCLFKIFWSVFTFLLLTRFVHLDFHRWKHLLPTASGLLRLNEMQSDAHVTFSVWMPSSFLTFLFFGKGSSAECFFCSAMLLSNSDSKSSRAFVQRSRWATLNEFLLCPALSCHSFEMMVCIGCRPPATQYLLRDRIHLSQCSIRETCSKTADKFITDS